MMGAVHRFEWMATRVRRGIPWPTDHPVWRTVRPVYRRVLKTTAKRGLQRTMNGTDPIRIMPDLYNLLETYEPEVWRMIMDEVRPGDAVADVGASIGLYTVALARRVGPRGRVYAFEPDTDSARTLRQLLDLNGVASRVELIQQAVGERHGVVDFIAGRGSESHVGSVAVAGGTSVRVPVVTLDAALGERGVDLVKIDVEGFEESVLRGATRLLGDPVRAPRTMFIEVHPYAWPSFGASDTSLLSLLRGHGYTVTDVQGRPVERVTSYGEIVARRVTPAA